MRIWRPAAPKTIMSHASKSVHLLHVVTKRDDPLAQSVIDQQRSDPELTLRIVDLTLSNPDYDALLAAVFEADSIQVW